MKRQPRVMIIAGEASGDLHGAKLIHAIKQYRQEAWFFGIGGHEMNSVGVRIIMDSGQLSVVGITEVFTRLNKIIRGIALAKKALREIRPDLLILIDFPDFNLHIAATAKKLNIPVLYYISPQVWAWRSNRVNKIKRRVDHMAVIFPFEEVFYRRQGVPVTFVGHPLMDSTNLKKVNFPIDSKSSAKTIALLPGSRDKEVLVHLPIMLHAAILLRQKDPELKFVISCAGSVNENVLRKIVHETDCESRFKISRDKIETLLNRCTMAVAVSGTVTLQAAICLTPMIIIYKVSPFSYFLGKRLVKVNHIGLVNLVGGKRLVPELVQNDASPANIAECVLLILHEDGRLEQMREDLRIIRNRLGDPGASDRTARIALSYLI